LSAHDRPAGRAPIADEELIARYRLAPQDDASRGFIDELFRRHHSRVVAWCYRLTGDRVNAVDLAQDVFVKAWTSLDTFRADSKFTTWLYVILRNRWRDELRARQARPREAPETEIADAEPFIANEALAALTAHDARTLVRRLMDGALDEMEQQVMTLHYAQEMTLDAITAALGLTNASGAKSYIVSARRKMNAAISRWKTNT
jgi:RNA polymerase sigma-70 factor (ECF subfamily)